MVSIAADATNQTPHAMGERIEKARLKQNGNPDEPQGCRFGFEVHKVLPRYINAGQAFVGGSDSAD